MDACKNAISAYLASHIYLRLGTVTASSTPQVHTVGYVSEEGCVVYFVTDRKSRKAENIARNPAVAYTVDENYEDILKIQGVQMEGRASLVSKGNEIRRIMGLMTQKFPVMKDMAPDPDLVIFKVAPVKGYFLDNTHAFGHRSAAEF